ncbi:OmpA family protein [Verrucomicrobiaceae bacterium 5K15]|uniref:OmpA family protein n=1 Tax=Oceaniferula flava TaxID=2800421 RepID=A0AAE2VB87_9BACT|nr:OmpA family protein [Oceaniferula flavus]MBK1854265.1 OmpA family protein [Oceaniferula flavus]MBM1135571.1 OmpA family protein [Oceaniferula flavus]
MEHTRSKTPYIFFISVIVLTLIAMVLLVRQCSSQPADDGTGQDGAADTEQSAADADSISLTVDGKHVDETSTARTGTPEELVGHIRDLIVEANDSGDAQDLIKFLGEGALTDQQSKDLHQLAASTRLKLDSSEPFSLLKNADDRWAMNLADRQRILLDLAKTQEGQWKVNTVTLPGERRAANAYGIDPATPEDERQAAITVHKFMEAILKLDPTSARSFVDESQVNYAKLAGLCIVFEEGAYQLAEDRAVRKMFLRDKSAGWLARVTTKDATQMAMFAISTKRKDANSPWKITEINLDKLLADYAGRFSGGDIYYTPLIKNPKGGDSLAIYFDLDSEELTARTKRQLKIVANLLKNDAGKKLTISGHTDALGSDAHNLKLSEQRARKVMAYLTEQGVNAPQMMVTGYGKSQPRRPNTTQDGKDAPDGRRANRRAEILLNF